MQRNRIMKHLVFVVVTLLCLSCKDFKEVEVIGVKDFKINKLSLTGIEADIQLIINNPNNVGFSIYPSEFDVFFSELNVGKARLKKRVHIDANCDRTYHFELNSSFAKMTITDLTKMLSGSKLGMLQVKGNLKAGKLWLKKSIPIDYKTNNYNMIRGI